MIKTVSEFLNEFLIEEKRKLDSFSLSHAPTIGKMYEGLSAEILSKGIPEAFNLSVKNGFVHDGRGEMTGQIDCMLVKGDGEQIPFTDAYKWHVKDVIAVFEVKKNLYAKDLEDSFHHLRSVIKSHGSYLKAASSNEKININPTRRAFAEITGTVSPNYENLASYSFEEQMIFHTLVMEQFSPIRIVLAYHGYKTESSLRKGMLKFLFENQMSSGFGLGSFPQLIICGDFSLVKMNGFPFSARMTSEYWDFFASSRSNPVSLILESIWTRLSHFDNSIDFWGEDLSCENFIPLLSGHIKKIEDKIGWEYNYHEISDAQIASVPPSEKWEPRFVTMPIFVAFNRLCTDGELVLDDPSLKSFLDGEGYSFDRFFQELIETGLVSKKRNSLFLNSIACQCVILPDGRFAIADNNSGRLSRWISKNVEKNMAELERRRRK